MVCRRVLVDLATLGTCALFSAAGCVVATRIAQAQPPLDHSAAYRRAVAAQFDIAYALYQQQEQAATRDLQTLLAFEARHGAPATYPESSQVDVEYRELYAIWLDDRQALRGAVSDYNELCTSAYTAPYRPTDLPASLTVPAP